VHEYGHQVLYRAMEIDPLVDDDGTAEFTLPWSGSVRDFYGYFHAFYIYALLAAYYSRVQACRESDSDRAAERFEGIVEGLVRASEDFDANAHRFTRTGVAFSQGLIARVEALADGRRHGFAVAG
jgi:HEXXH motif-containing protein